MHYMAYILKGCLVVLGLGLVLAFVCDCIFGDGLPSRAFGSKALGPSPWKLWRAKKAMK